MDKRKNQDGSARPLMPRLAASASPAIKAPQGPRLAGTATPPSAPSRNAHALPTTPSPYIAPKVAAGISPNVTPRSSERRHRGQSPTNRATPSTTGPVGTFPYRPAAAASTSSVNSTGVISRTGTFERTDSSPTRRVERQPRPQTGPPDLSTSILKSNSSAGGLAEPAQPQKTFFHANDARSKEPAPRRVLHKKSASFVYANGTSEDTLRQIAAVDNQHFNVPVTHSSKNSSLVGAQVAQQRSPLSPPIASQLNSSPFFRSPSPPKEAGFHLSYRKGASQIMRPTSFTSLSPPPETSVDPETRRSPVRRKSSLDSTSEHHSRRTLSVSSIGSGFQGIATEIDAARTSSAIPNFPVAFAQISPVASPSLVESPKTTSADGSQSWGEAAAHARRERKVLDLEISNSSLLAINKSLEREVRRQKLELRRFRRMTRATERSSLFSNSTVDSFGTLGELMEDEDEDRSSGQDLLGDLDSEEDISGTESNEEDSLSPGVLEQRDARHRINDQRRLQLDLAKHKELLLDSQKMNQSLKRCLGVTEQLIKDGNKALEYKVNHADVVLGGRVLSPEEREPYSDDEHHQDPSQDKSYFPRWSPSKHSSFALAESIGRFDEASIADQDGMTGRMDAGLGLDMPVAVDG